MERQTRVCMSCNIAVPGGSSPCCPAASAVFTIPDVIRELRYITRRAYVRELFVKLYRRMKWYLFKIVMNRNNTYIHIWLANSHRQFTISHQPSAICHRPSTTIDGSYRIRPSIYIYIYIYIHIYMCVCVSGWVGGSVYADCRVGKKSIAWKISCMNNWTLNKQNFTAI